MAYTDYSSPGFQTGVSQGEEQAGWENIKSLYDLMDINSQKTSKEIERIKSTFGNIAKSLAATSSAFGGYIAKKKMKYQTMPGVQEYFAKQEYANVSGPTTSKGLQPKVPWADLDEAAKAKFLEKYTPSEVEQTWGEYIFGDEKRYKFGEHEIPSSEMTTVDLARKFGMDIDVDISQFKSEPMPSAWEELQEWYKTR